MKGSASQPHHTCRREEGKRSAQAGGMPAAGGVRDRSRMAATHRGAGRGAQPAEPDGGTPGRTVKNRTRQRRYPTPPKTIQPKQLPRTMTTAARTETTAWAFRTRFRRGAFGWKGTQLAIGRINEALTEIRAVARHDTACAAEGAVLLLEKLSPALCQIDSSSGALGNATYATVQELAPLISQIGRAHV